MKGLLLTASLIAFAGVASAQDVGVSVHVNQPGFYGEVNIGSMPQPQIIYPQPVVIVPEQMGPPPPPIYLRVPPGHRKNWKKYCYDYRACGRPVYFVQEQWYQQVYLPQYYRERGEEYRGYGDDHSGHHGKGHGHGHGHGHDRDDDHGHGRGHDHGDDDRR